MASKYDGIIFDMDGTLWDAVDSYCSVWNRTIEEFGLTGRSIERSQLIDMMGKTLDKIIEVVLPQMSGNEGFITRLRENEQAMMPKLGGKLYDDVAEILAKLSKTYKLLMVSNCSANGLPNFLRFTGLESYISDTLSNGDNGLDKASNIGLIMERNVLQSALYVGDTESDREACSKAGVDFAWASYGFGKNVVQPEYTLKKFSDILTIV